MLVGSGRIVAQTNAVSQRFGCDRGGSFRRLWSSRAERLKLIVAQRAWEKSREHFRQAIEADPKGNFGRLARVGS